MANNKLILLIFISIIFCQFNNIDITIELNRIDHIDKQIFENFDYNIKNYMQTNNFCPDCEDMEINIKCLFSIQKIVTSGSKKIIYSHIYISNNKDHYFYSKDVIFPYKKNKSLTFNPYSNNSLESLLNYYLYFFVALELDTWGLELGTAYLNKINQIADNLITSSYSSGWKDRKENLKQLKLNYEYRHLRYLFYYLINEVDLNNISEKHYNQIIELNNKINYQHKKYGYEKNSLKLIQSYPEDFAKLFDSINLNDAIKTLIMFDENNKNIYQKYLK